VGVHLVDQLGAGHPGDHLVRVEQEAVDEIRRRVDLEGVLY